LRAREPSHQLVVGTFNRAAPQQLNAQLGRAARENEYPVGKYPVGKYPQPVVTTSPTQTHGSPSLIQS